MASPSQRYVGVVRQGKIVSAEFQLRNTYSCPIDIINIKHTCGCTTHSLSKMNLDPDEVVKFTMSMDTKYRRDTVGASSFIEYCKRDEEKKSCQLVIQMAADIDPDYEAEPKGLTFQKGKPAIRELHLVSHHGKSPGIAKVECVGKCFSTKPISRDKGMTKGVSVAYDPRKDHPDDTTEELVIHTDCENQPIHRVPLLLKP